MAGLESWRLCDAPDSSDGGVGGGNACVLICGGRCFSVEARYYDRKNRVEEAGSEGWTGFFFFNRCDALAGSPPPPLADLLPSLLAVAGRCASVAAGGLIICRRFFVCVYKRGL